MTVKEKHIVLLQNHTFCIIEKNLNRLGIKTITRTSKTIKETIATIKQSLIPTQVYIKFGAKTVLDLIQEKQIEIYPNELMNTKGTLNQAIFLTLWLFITSQPTTRSTSNTRISPHSFMIKTNVELWNHPPFHITKLYNRDQDFIKYHLL